MTELTDYFNENSFPEIVYCAKVVGIASFLQKFIPFLLEEKFEISVFLAALELYLLSQGFCDEVTVKVQEACAELVKIERQRKEAKEQQNNGLS
jgi:hypothetical protein